MTRTVIDLKAGTLATVPADDNFLAEVSATASPAEQSAALVGRAQALLDASDVTVIRCAENAVLIPAAWKAYRTALRAIVAGGAGVIPPRPDYPSGT